MIGLYGFTEVFSGLTDISVKSFPLKKTSLIGAAKLWWKYRWLSVRTSILGYIIGVAPGIGANVSCWVGYDHARSTSKEPEKFGKGSIEGLIGAKPATWRTFLERTPLFYRCPSREMLQPPSC